MIVYGTHKACTCRRIVGPEVLDDVILDQRVFLECQFVTSYVECQRLDITYSPAVHAEVAVALRGVGSTEGDCAVTWISHC